MIKIGSVEIPSNVILAPMAGCTDLSFRLIAREHGAKFCFFEMVDCNSITYGQKRRVRSILRTNKDDLPIAAQLLGRDPDRMLEGAKEMIAMARISFLDINAACPAKKVIKKRAGAYLLKDEAELCKIVRRLSAGLNIPVTVKIRTGFDKQDLKTLAGLARKCEGNGAQAIFIHGRTRIQGYAGEIDYASIRAVKESVQIPVIGSGNIFSPDLARTMTGETGCDGILVARGALGNPWIFNAIEKVAVPAGLAFKSRKEVLVRHLGYIERFNESSPSGKLGYMRKVTLWYTKGFRLAKRIRDKVSLVNSYDKMLELIESL